MGQRQVAVRRTHFQPVQRGFLLAQHRSSSLLGAGATMGVDGMAFVRPEPDLTGRAGRP